MQPIGNAAEHAAYRSESKSPENRKIRPDKSLHYLHELLQWLAPRNNPMHFCISDQAGASGLKVLDWVGSSLVTQMIWVLVEDRRAAGVPSSVPGRKQRILSFYYGLVQDRSWTGELKASS